jgi:hypothetical protein
VVRGKVLSVWTRDVRGVDVNDPIEAVSACDECSWMHNHPAPSASVST